MTAPLRIVAVLGPRWTVTSALAAQLSACAAADALPPGVIYPVGAAWFGQSPDGVTTHSELVELTGRSRPADTVSTMRARPAHARQVVRDRLRRVADDARLEGAHTLLLVAPGAAWHAEPKELRRELRAASATIDIVLPVRRPDQALAAALAQSVRLADTTGETTLTARAALSDEGRTHEQRYAELLRRWVDPDGEVRVLVTPAARSAGAHTLFATLGIAPPAGDPAALGVDSPVTPPPSAEALEQIASAARIRSRLGWVPGVRRRIDERLVEARRAADAAAREGAEPFAFTDSERRMLARRFRADREAVRAHVAWQWPGGPPAGPLREAWLAWFAED